MRISDDGVIAGNHRRLLKVFAWFASQAGQRITALSDKFKQQPGYGNEVRWHRSNTGIMGAS
jgi:hypothetical protein